MNALKPLALAAAAWLAAAPVVAETLLVVRKTADALDLLDPGSGGVVECRDTGQDLPLEEFEGSAATG